MSTSGSLQPPSPIQRILIFHLNLPELCMNGKSLGEGASVEEISESILFYHRDYRSGTASPDESIDGKLNGPTEDTSLTEEAVQFLGLCTALRGLPASLGDPELEADTTNEIYFGNSTLVFISLESSTSLLAVAQISRLYQNGKKLDHGGGNPLAIRSSISRCHKLFCMLRGGGVLHRLSSEQRSRQPGAQSTTGGYPGMHQLYKLLKKLRHTREQTARKKSSAGKEYTELENIEALQSDIRTLRQSLPIHSIRRDLDAFYKEYLGDLSVVVNRNGGAGRCLVETIPVPIAQDSGSHVFRSTPSDASSASVATLELALRQLLQDFSRTDRKEPHLIGVSTFHKGELIYTHTSDKCMLEGLLDGPKCVTLSNEIAYLLLGYMASYRTKMSQLSIVSQPQSLQATPPSGGLGLKGLTLSLGSLADEAFQNFDEISTDSANDRIDPSHFMPPPPLFMFSAQDHAHCFVERNNRKVWAPKIHLPVCLECEDHTENVYMDSFVLLFELHDFSFLLYLGFEMSQPNHEQVSICKLFLTRLDKRLTDAVLLTSETISSEVLTEPEITHLPTHWDGPGQDLILVNRQQHKLLLLSDRKPIISVESRKLGPGRNPPRRLWGFGPRQSEKRTNLAQHAARSSSSEWSVLGLDCRHLLASHLHLDTLLAFDDMMNEVAKRRDILQWSESSQIKLELCTCMPLGWVYACVDGENELYAFFDSSIYVTVADVQGAAHKIKENSFGR